MPINTKIETILYKNNILQPVKGFISVVEAGSISAGARRINLTQVTVTKQIQTLERELGIPLFDRTNRTCLKLTQDGKNFYDFVVKKLVDLENVFKDFLNKKYQEDNSILKIAGDMKFLSGILSSCIKKLKDTNEFKDTKIELFNVSKKEGINMLKKEEVDIALYPVKNYEKSDYVDIKLEIFRKIEFLLIVSKNHPLAKGKNIEKKEISKYPYLFLDKYNYYNPYESFENLMPSDIKCKNATWEVLVEYVKNDFGTLFVHKEYYENFLKYNKYISTIDVSGLMLNTSLAIFTRKSDNIKKQARFVIDRLMEMKNFN